MTGGGLSFEKCKVSIMKWKSDFGGRQVLLEDKSNKSIELKTKEYDCNKIKLQRLEPCQAEHILGIWLPMTGQMVQEYRLNQIKKLALTVYHSPFTPRDAAMIYNTRYTLMIRYALPITNFSSTQLHEIQRKIIFYLLPKMGINRHTPRDMI